ncbi:DNA internalization-related competence protein ComEC/Rec2 [Butyrivibrio sp. XB500-5]|uniref:DNA internalization-related competence protein ComEC/Rec2 n=1 Tax=Butyrivibrio sp. XB500-5 TaxID=2364880 RepID=UPI000EAACAE3|nr:DNA internalization-related competence protein ComEC/Rec2 [Butyrivibrio sp. XB500-5]RKM62942.1 DNA internalization-related competence protein ComEC/Rec2 [Butyrivibrio sp. XB500-5]
MKRPFVVIASLITAIVFIYLNISFDNIVCMPAKELDGSFAELIGVVSKKELKTIYSGDIVSVIYLVPKDKFQRKTKYIECYLDPSEEKIPNIGEEVLVKGKVYTFKAPRNPGEFDSRLYYSTLKISYRIKNAEIIVRNGNKDIVRESLSYIRYRLEEALDSSLSSEDSAVMKAMLLGDRAFMDDEIKELYKNSGIVHILAVSGLHIMVIGMGIYKLLKRFKISPWINAAIPLLFMYLYGEMCGISSSSFRAICMFCLRLIAPLVGRTYDLLSALALAEILLIIDQPLYLYNSGFLFSFGAVLGITVVKPRLEKSLFHNSKVKENIIAQGLLAGISVMLVTLPVYLEFYYTYPIYSLITNIIVIPLMGVLLVCGVLCLPVGYIIGSVPVMTGAPVNGLNIPGIAVHGILTLYKILCGIQNNMPGNMLYPGHKEWYRVVIYYVLLSVWLHMQNRNENKRTFSLMIPALALTILCITIPHGLKITAIDVGQGDGIVIEAGRRNILIDGGSSSNNKVGKYSVIPFLRYEGIGQLDAIVVSHEDEDHISGILEIMDGMKKGGIKVRMLILPDVSESSRGDNYHSLETMAKELDIPIEYMSKGEGFELPVKDGISTRMLELTCLNPTEKMSTEGANAYSTVLHMRYGMFTALFTGDVEKEGEDQLVDAIRANTEKYGDITLLKVAHHGSQYTTCEEFLELTHPKLAVISCGENNSYGHPHGELLERLKEHDARIYRTDKLGAISFAVSFEGEVRVSSMLKPQTIDNPE